MLETAAQRSMILNADVVTASANNGNAVATKAAPMGQRVFILGFEADYSDPTVGFKTVQLQVDDNDASPTETREFIHDFTKGPLRVTFATPLHSRYGPKFADGVTDVSPHVLLPAGGVGGQIGTVSMFYVLR